MLAPWPTLPPLLDKRAGSTGGQRRHTPPTDTACLQRAHATASRVASVRLRHQQDHADAMRHKHAAWSATYSKLPQGARTSSTVPMPNTAPTETR